MLGLASSSHLVSVCSCGWAPCLDPGFSLPLTQSGTVDAVATIQLSPPCPRLRQSLVGREITLQKIISVCAFFKMQNLTDKLLKTNGDFHLISWDWLQECIQDKVFPAAAKPFPIQQSHPLIRSVHKLLPRPVIDSGPTILCTERGFKPAVRQEDQQCQAQCVTPPWCSHRNSISLR